MDKFLETYNLPRLNHDGTENLNRLITVKGIKSVIRNLPTNRSPEPNGFTSKFFHIQRRILIFLKLFQKTEEEETLPNSFHEASVTPIPKPDNMPQENYRPISLRT